MLKNMLKISIRNILKERTYSLINIFGLTIGITASVFIMLYVSDELSYDKYHANGENIYRIVSNIQEPDNAFTWAVAQFPLAPELRAKYPEVENYVRISGQGRIKLMHEDLAFYEEDIYMADSTVFDVFTYRFLEGDIATALDALTGVTATAFNQITLSNFASEGVSDVLYLTVKFSMFVFEIIIVSISSVIAIVIVPVSKPKSFPSIYCSVFPFVILVFTSLLNTVLFPNSATFSMP